MADNPDSVKGWLTTRQIAPLLSMSESGVVRAARAGRLGTVDTTPGGHRRFDPVRVVAALRARGASVPVALERRAGGVDVAALAEIASKASGATAGEGGA